MLAGFGSRVCNLVAGAAIVVCLSFSAQSLRAQGAPDFETIALAGGLGPLPDPDAGFTLSGLSVPSINSSGQTVFSSFFFDGRAFGSGILSDASGTLATVAQTGDQVPDAANGVTFNGFGSNFFSGPDILALNDSGQTAFLGRLNVTDVNGISGSGIYSGGLGTLSQVARTGDQAPGAVSGTVFSDFGDPLLNNSGQTVFRAGLSGSGVNETNDGGIYSEGSGTLAQVARAGDQAPGASSGVVFDNFNNPVLNASGQTAFRASLAGTGVDEEINSEGIYSEGSGTLTQVARAGDQAPGGGGSTFNFFEDPVLNALGQTAFRASLWGTVDSTNDEGVYITLSGSLVQVARTGDQAPGAIGDVAFGAFLSDPILSDSGQIAIEGFLVGDDVSSANNGGLYVTDQDGQLRQVVRTGDAAPDTGDGIVFDSFSEIALNGSGQLAFRANLDGTDVDEELNNNDTAIFATGVDGELVLIAREGDLFDVDDDPLAEDLRTISFLTFANNSGNGDGQASGFNDQGQIAFRLNFTDGTSGIFISNLVAAAAPEPILIGDVNRDGFVNLGDIAPFIELLFGDVDEFRAEADIDGNGLINLGDIGPFIDILFP